MEEDGLCEEEEDDFYKGMNMLSLSPTNEAEKKPPAVPVADIKRLSPPTITTNKTRKNKKKKKKKKNKTKKSSGENENIDDLIGEYRKKDLRKLEKLYVRIIATPESPPSSPAPLPKKR